MDIDFKYFIDSCELIDDRLTVAGWVFHASHPIAQVELRDGNTSHPLELVPSPDVATVHGERATRARFVGTIRLGDPRAVERVVLHVTLRGTRSALRLPVFGAYLQDRDPYHELFREFCSRVHALTSPAVLELGARARSGISVTSLFQGQVRYTGLDIVAGENVHIVGDAHRLADLVAPEAFDAIFSISVFEHLAMPWKVALECNKVLKRGGLMYVATHQTWPLHDAPWDFWRFSSSAWPALFNAATGFRVVKAIMGLPATITSKYPETPSTYALHEQPAFLGSAVIAEKISNTSLTWPVDLESVASGVYPA